MTGDSRCFHIPGTLTTFPGLTDVPRPPFSAQNSQQCGMLFATLAPPHHRTFPCNPSYLICPPPDSFPWMCTYRWVRHPLGDVTWLLCTAPLANNMTLKGWGTFWGLESKLGLFIWWKWFKALPGILLSLSRLRSNGWRVMVDLIRDPGVGGHGVIRNKNLILEVNSERLGVFPYLCLLDVVCWLVPGDISIYHCKRASQGETQLNGNCLGREGSQWLNLMMQKKRSWKEHYKLSKQGWGEGEGLQLGSTEND